MKSKLGHYPPPIWQMSYAPHGILNVVELNRKRTRPPSRVLRVKEPAADPPTLPFCWLAVSRSLIADSSNEKNATSVHLLAQG
jgi:hypothetical protein